MQMRQRLHGTPRLGHQVKERGLVTAPGRVSLLFDLSGLTSSLDGVGNAGWRRSESGRWVSIVELGLHQVRLLVSSLWRVQELVSSYPMEAWEYGTNGARCAEPVEYGCGTSCLGGAIPRVGDCSLANLRNPSGPRAQLGQHTSETLRSWGRTQLNRLRTEPRSDAKGSL